MRLKLLAVLLWLPLSAMAQEEWQVKSASEQAQFVQLFTSQGCSSCPPADRWLSKFKATDRLWSEVVPVAFHVTYWDYLGWRDVFARSEHDQRQRSEARRLGAGVYTPGVFVNGQEWRGWRRGGELDSRPQVGQLQAQAKGRNIRVTFADNPELGLSHPVVELTYLRAGESTDVLAGENRGRRLEHDFVASRVVSVPLERVDNTWTAKLRAAQTADTKAVALWVRNSRGEFVQAAGGWVDEAS